MRTDIKSLEDKCDNDFWDQRGLAGGVRIIAFAIFPNISLRREYLTFMIIAHDVLRSTLYSLNNS